MRRQRVGAWVWALFICRTAWALPPSLPDTPDMLVVPSAAAAGIRAEPFGVQCMSTTLTTVGRVTFDAMRVSHVVSPVSGRVDRVLAQPGDLVAAKAPLATIHSLDFATARADWHKAQVALDGARRDLRRQEGLYRRHAAPEQVVLAAWDLYRRAQSEFERAASSLSLLGGQDGAAASDTYTLRSPLQGEVVSRHVNAGMEISGLYGGGAGQELFLVADLSRVWIIAEVPEADVGRVAPRARVVAHVDALPGEALEGTLDYVAETLDPSTHTARVRTAMNNPHGKLKPDMFVTLAIDASGRSALALPPQAVIHLGEATFVYVEKTEQNQAPEGPRTFERRHVIVDENGDGPHWPVQFGLQLGDRVVTQGAQALAARHAEVAP